jgi:AbrB family looped-hinge helix DNA binding protein
MTVMIEAIRRVGKKAQITIPKKITEKLAIAEGDRLLVKLKGGDIVITPIVPVRKHNYLTEQDLHEALAQADREFAEGSAKVYEDAGQLFKEAGWIEEEDGI